MYVITSHSKSSTSIYMCQEAGINRKNKLLKAINRVHRVGVIPPKVEETVPNDPQMGVEQG